MFSSQTDQSQCPSSENLSQCPVVQRPAFPVDPGDQVLGLHGLGELPAPGKALGGAAASLALNGGPVIHSG
jgi:hypothetical protein